MAERPMSRGYNLGAPPGTGMRGGGGPPPRTGMRTANLKTGGQREANFNGVGMNTPIAMENSAVTMGGLKAMRPGTSGPGRQVQDTSYFIGVLRQKIGELSSETNKFKSEIDRFQADNNSYVKYERRYEELLKDVRDLEGTLADYNLAKDKTRAGVDPEKVANYQMQLEQRNHQENREVDSIFLERQRREQMVGDMEEEIMNYLRTAENKINQLPENDREEYHELMNENQQLGQQLGQARGELEAVSQQVRVRERELGRNNMNDEYAAVEKQIRDLEQDRQSVQDELEMTRLDPDEARQRLLHKVKADNGRITELSEGIERAEKENEQHQQQFGDLQAEVEERKNDTGNSQKYEMLFQRDQEMSEFIDKFEGHKQQEVSEKDKTKTMVVELLKHLSQSAELEANMNGMGGLEGAEFKGGSATKNTQGRLEQELMKRREELEKINSLGSKINVEMGALKVKMDVMTRDLSAFGDLDGLRHSSDMTREYLNELKKAYEERRGAVQLQANALASRYEKKKAQLADNDTAKALEGMEQRLRHYEQSIFHLQEYISEKERETDFQSQKEVCGRVIDDLNALIIDVTSNQVLMPTQY